MKTSTTYLQCSCKRAMTRLVSFSLRRVFLAVVLLPAALCQAYDPGCPFATAEPVVLSIGSYPLMFVPTKWCGIAQAPSMADPTRACQAAGDYRTVLWRRHERA